MLFSTFSLTTSHTIPDELISFIRLFLLSPADYAKQASKERMPRPKLDSESAKVALKLFGERLADYDTSIEVSFLSFQLSSIYATGTNILFVIS